MKIIKRGKLPPIKGYRGTCENCGTEVEVVHGEAHYIGKNKVGADCMGIKCPLKSCKYNIVLEEIT